MHIFNMCGTCLQRLKALGGVDFIVYKQWSKMAMLKNAVNLSKINFSVL